MADLILSRNGRKPNDPSKDLVTREEAQQIAQDMCIAVCEHYLSQVPQKVAEMVVAFFEAQGMKVQPPPGLQIVQPEKPEDVQ